MPQLDIVYILPIYLCAWLSIILMSKKISMVALSTKLKTPHPHKNPRPTAIATPWT